MDSDEEDIPEEGQSLLKLTLECPRIETLKPKSAHMDAWAVAQAQALRIVGRCVRHFLRGRDVFLRWAGELLCEFLLAAADAGHVFTLRMCSSECSQAIDFG